VKVRDQLREQFPEKFQFRDETTKYMNTKRVRNSRGFVNQSEEESKDSHDVVEIDVDDSNQNHSNNETSMIPAWRQIPRHPSQCLEVTEPLYQNLRAQQLEYHTQPYMHHQRKINARMRRILVDWLIEVHHKFRLTPPILWLAVNLLDRYLSRTEIERPDLQCYGIVSLWIAAKYEEIFAFQVQDCVTITDNAFTKEEILNCEECVLRGLDYQVCVPTGYHFLARFMFSLDMSPLQKCLANFFAERALQEHELLIHSPELVAATACYLSMYVVHEIVRNFVKRFTGEMESHTCKTTGRSLRNAQVNEPNVAFNASNYPSNLPIHHGFARNSFKTLNYTYAAGPDVASSNLNLFLNSVMFEDNMYHQLYHEVYGAGAATRGGSSLLRIDMRDDRLPWDELYRTTIGFQESELQSLAYRLQQFSCTINLTASRRRLEAARKKYSRYYRQVAMLPPLAYEWNLEPSYNSSNSSSNSGNSGSNSSSNSSSSNISSGSSGCNSSSSSKNNNNNNDRSGSSGGSIYITSSSGSAVSSSVSACSGAVPASTPPSSSSRSIQDRREVGIYNNNIDNEIRASSRAADQGDVVLAGCSIDLVNNSSNNHRSRSNSNSKQSSTDGVPARSRGRSRNSNGGNTNTTSREDTRNSALGSNTSTTRRRSRGNDPVTSCSDMV